MKQLEACNKSVAGMACRYGAKGKTFYVYHKTGVELGGPDATRLTVRDTTKSKLGRQTDWEPLNPIEYPHAFDTMKRHIETLSAVTWKEPPKPQGGLLQAIKEAEEKRLKILESTRRLDEITFMDEEFPDVILKLIGDLTELQESL